MHRALKVLAFFGIWIATWGQSAQAQTVSYQEVNGPAVQAHGQRLRMPWAGGFNSPQFSPIDLNHDGQDDLFVFDRGTQRVLTFLAVQTNGQWQYQVAPQYTAAFPKDLKFFALLRDFNCDGAPDIFTAGTFGIKVYTNVSTTAEPLQFDLTHPLLLYNTTANLQVGSEDLPAIVDLDGDGDLDVLMWEWSGSTVLEYYQNQQVEQRLPCDSLRFTLVNNWYGRVTRCTGVCSSYRFGNSSCVSPLHVGGSSVLPLDLDADGDLDLLAGHDDCPDLMSLYNTGTNQVPLITRAELNLPPDITGQQFSVFPAAYYLDVTFDGVPDLVIAPNMTSNAHRNVDLRQSVWFYANTGTAAHPRFQGPKQPFLQDQMIDVGEAAAPALADLDGDGDLDMLVGTTAILEDQTYAAAFTLFRNTGTAQEAAFTLEDADYLGLFAQNLQYLKPQFLDLNGDNVMDLLWSAYNATSNKMEIKYILNEAAAGQPAQFSLGKAQTLTGVSFFRGDTPYVYDVDADGQLDILLGHTSGGLHYYRNSGSFSAPVWNLVTEKLGGIAANTDRLNLQVHIADVNRDGQPDLLTSDANGQLRLYSNFRANLNGTFTAEENLLVDASSPTNLPLAFGTSMAMTVGELQASGLARPELLIGTLGGGIRFLQPVNGKVAYPGGDVLQTLVYPNPAYHLTQLVTPQDARYTLYNAVAAVILEGQTQAQAVHQINTLHLASGMYILRVVLTDGTTSTHRVVVQH